jgi:membrane protease subunit (stomatin/prohibitin family)
MGFMDKLRAELVDVIEWIDDGRSTLVWRFPRYHNQIKNGAQLIVRPGQVAVFVHQGKIADVFEPGQHRLETSNLPVLSTLGGWLYGFDSPFKAEVYFVSTRQITDLRWGTPNHSAPTRCARSIRRRCSRCWSARTASTPPTRSTNSCVRSSTRASPT